jgi:hypothetical protein
MSSQRPIKDEMWSDDWFYDLDPSEKLLWVFLLTNDRQNVAGVFKANERWIGANTGFEKQVVEMILSRFEKLDKIRRVDDWIIITNHYKHQSLSPKIEAGIKRIVGELPKNVLKRYPMDMVCIRYRTLLNLTLPNFNISEQSSVVTEENMSFKNKRRYNEDGHWEEPAIDADTGEELAEPIDTEKEAEKELNEKIRHNLRLVEEPRGLPFGTGKDMAYHVKIYRDMLKAGWSHDSLVTGFIELINSEYWKEKREVGQYPGMNTLQSILRNQQPS